MKTYKVNVLGLNGLYNKIYKANEIVDETKVDIQEIPKLLKNGYIVEVSTDIKTEVETSIKTVLKTESDTNVESVETNVETDIKTEVEPMVKKLIKSKNNV